MIHGHQSLWQKPLTAMCKDSRSDLNSRPFPVPWGGLSPFFSNDQPRHNKRCLSQGKRREKIGNLDNKRVIRYNPSPFGES
jgi:hypothetical protein